MTNSPSIGLCLIITIMELMNISCSLIPAESVSSQHFYGSGLYREQWKTYVLCVFLNNLRREEHLAASEIMRKRSPSVIGVLEIKISNGKL